MEVFSLIFAVLIGSVSLLVTYSYWKYNYWKRKGLPYLQPTFPLGNTKNPFTRKETVGDIVKQWYDELKRKGLKHGGVYMFLKPIYLPTDPTLIRCILVKDFQHFSDRGIPHDERNNPLSANLFTVDGTLWKTLRTKLTPTFTSGKMRMMFDTLLQCTEPFLKAVEGQAVDIKEVLSKFTVDVIGSCAFGLECNSFGGEETEFIKYGRGFFDLDARRVFKNVVRFNLPAVGRVLGLKAVDEETERFFMDLVERTIEYRETNGVTRNDFMQLLINMKKEDDSLGLGLLTAQAFLFFLAGFETSSTTMTFCLYELALHEDIQSKAREEINDVIKGHEGQLTYDGLSEMKYLQQIIDETLRLHPPAEGTHRTCSKPYQLPDTNTILEKGTMVLIPIKALHLDAEYYPEPYKFDPERFSSENKAEIKPFTFLPFGDGPRNCIGLRFDLMQTKVGLSVLLKNFRFTLNERTKIPLKLNPRAFVASVVDGIWLNVEKL
nr:cytochrome P450 monooxygenase CYP6BK31 [Lasioderma serricorne]